MTRPPTTPLSSSALLTRNRADPALGQELARGIASSDEVEALVAFITVGGVRALRDGLESFSRLRLLATRFSGTTEVAALESLARLPGVEVPITLPGLRNRCYRLVELLALGCSLRGPDELENPRTLHDQQPEATLADLPIERVSVPVLHPSRVGVAVQVVGDLRRRAGHVYSV